MASGRLFSAVKWILLMQTLTIGSVAALALIFWDWQAAKSALLGGVVAFLPNAYFAAKFGYRDPSHTATDIVKAFYSGETIKLIITAALFYIIFQLHDILFLPLFAGFVPVIMVFWFALLVRKTEL